MPSSDPVYLAARSASTKGVSSSLNLMIKRSKILYVNETNRKLDSKPAQQNNSYAENVTLAKQGRQYLTQSEISTYVGNRVSDPANYGNI
jgi:hypothetical protein